MKFNKSLFLSLVLIDVIVLGACRATDANKVNSVVGKDSIGMKLGPVPPKVTSKKAKASLALEDSTSGQNTTSTSGTSSSTSNSTAGSSSPEKITVPEGAIQTKNGYWAKPEEKYSEISAPDQLQYYDKAKGPQPWLGNPQSDGSFKMNEIKGPSEVDTSKNFYAKKDPKTGEWYGGDVKDVKGNDYNMTGNNGQKIQSQGFSYNKDGTTNFNWKAVDETQNKSKEFKTIDSFLSPKFDSPITAFDNSGDSSKSVNYIPEVDYNVGNSEVAQDPSYSYAKPMSNFISVLLGGE